MVLRLFSWAIALLLLSFVFGVPVSTTVVSVTPTLSSLPILSTGFDHIIFPTWFGTTPFLQSTSTPSISSSTLSVTTPTPSSSVFIPDSSTSSSSVAVTPQTLAVPGRALQVLPIGLGVVFGLLGIVIIVVILVTFQRVKHRKEFRRKLAEERAREGKISPSSTSDESLPETQVVAPSQPPLALNEGIPEIVDDEKKTTEAAVVPSSKHTSSSSWPTDSSWPSPVTGEPPESLRDSFTSIQTVKLREMATQTTPIPWEGTNDLDHNVSDEEEDDSDSGPPTPKPPIRRNEEGSSSSG